LAAFSKAITLVAVGIHHLDLLKGGNDLSAGGNCLIVMNCKTYLVQILSFYGHPIITCSMFLKMFLNLASLMVLNQ